MENELLKTAIEAARLAGQELVRLWRTPLDTRSKGLRDIVTSADMAAERLVIETIRRHYPDHVIFSEESGESAGAGAGAAFQWFIDPLDGTTNYARGIPYFCVSVAVMRDSMPLAGAVYDPLHDRLYHALRGNGAYCKDRRLACSGRSRLLDLLVAFDWPRDDASRSRIARLVLEITCRVGGMRSLGSAALELCAVADGSADAYVHPSLRAWDTAAAGLIVEEAGGRVTEMDGSPAWWQGTTCLASNGLAHEPLLELIRQSSSGSVV